MVTISNQATVNLDYRKGDFIFFFSVTRDLSIFSFSFSNVSSRLPAPLQCFRNSLFVFVFVSGLLVLNFNKACTWFGAVCR